MGKNFGEIISPLDFNFANTPLFIYQPQFKNSTKNTFQSIKNFNTHYTKNFIKNPDLKNCGNTFNELIEQKKYSKLIPFDIKNKVSLTGTGSCFFSIEALDIPRCQRIKTKLL